MGELKRAMQIVGNLPKNVVTQYPTGRWGFVGSVAADLCFETVDGSPLTDAAVKKVVGSSSPAMAMRQAGLKRRTFETERAAIDALAAITG